MSEPSVTIGIPNYNQSHFISAALESAFEQDYPIQEIIIVDDCSTDNSVSNIESIIKTCKNPSIVNLLVHDKNKGLAGARNTYIKASKTDIVANLDADDIYYPNKISSSIKAFNIDYNGIGAVYSDYDIVDFHKPHIRRREFKHPFDARRLWHGCIVSTNSLLNRNIVNEIGLYDENLRFAEDYDLWLRMARQYLIYHIPENLFTYFLHGENMTLTHTQKFIEADSIIKDKYVKQFGSPV